MSGTESTLFQQEKGVARIKPEYIVDNHVKRWAEECPTSDDKANLIVNTIPTQENSTTGSQVESESRDPEKKKYLSKSEKKKLRGQNKARPLPFQVNREVILCHMLIDVLEGETAPVCDNKRCQNMHDVKAFMAIRPADIGTSCYIYETRGRCPRGVTCRFGSVHTTPEGYNKVNERVWKAFASKPLPTLNSLSKDVQHSLRKHKYNFDKSERILDEVKPNMQSIKGTKRTHDDLIKNVIHNLPSKNVETRVEEPNIQVSESENIQVGESKDQCMPSGPMGPVLNEDEIKLKTMERKKIHWHGKLCLSPLTTVGNLPFRRICKEYGVDITCGEMAMAASILQGHPPEWALTKRHESEDIFGVQLCGSNPYVMTRCAQVLQENTHIDFIDINMGCPIDLVYQQGGGSGLLRRERVLRSILECMNRILTIPLTVKTRTGISMEKNIAHNFMPMFRESGVSLITIHGRSREQRYTRLADWNYINECAKIAQPVSVFGNGDILSYEDYSHVMETYKNVAGVMVGRGALIKPWIFTEIKEQRLWDISSKERLDILKRFVNYGFDHWGSDTKGVETTRRFLLEWLSFLHRYIPVGILQSPPQKINERPPTFIGRDELETKMASPNCAQWVEISEMLLGPVPEGFHFLPKHKANSWK